MDEIWLWNVLDNFLLFEHREHGELCAVLHVGCVLRSSAGPVLLILGITCRPRSKTPSSPDKRRLKESSEEEEDKEEDQSEEGDDEDLEVPVVTVSPLSDLTQLNGTIKSVNVCFSGGAGESQETGGERTDRQGDLEEWTARYTRHRHRNTWTRSLSLVVLYVLDAVVSCRYGMPQDIYLCKRFGCNVPLKWDGLSTLLKIRLPKGGFYSDAIEEPFCLFQRTFQRFIFFLVWRT